MILFLIILFSFSCSFVSAAVGCQTATKIAECLNMDAADCAVKCTTPKKTCVVVDRVKKEPCNYSGIGKGDEDSPNKRKRQFGDGPGGGDFGTSTLIPKDCQCLCPSCNALAPSCSSHTNCEQCKSHDCVWCDNQCLSRPPPNKVCVSCKAPPKVSLICAQSMTCGACSAQGGCVWCQDNNICVDQNAACSKADPSCIGGALTITGVTTEHGVPKTGLPTNTKPPDSLGTTPSPSYTTLKTTMTTTTIASDVIVTTSTSMNSEDDQTTLDSFQSVNSHQTTTDSQISIKIDFSNVDIQNGQIEINGIGIIKSFDQNQQNSVIISSDNSIGANKDGFIDNEHKIIIELFEKRVLDSIELIEFENDVENAILSFSNENFIRKRENLNLIQINSSFTNTKQETIDKFQFYQLEADVNSQFKLKSFNVLIDDVNVVDVENIKSSEQTSNEMSIGLILAIVGGALFCVAIVLLLVMFLMKKGKNDDSSMSNGDVTYQSTSTFNSSDNTANNQINNPYTSVNESNFFQTTNNMYDVVPEENRYSSAPPTIVQPYEQPNETFAW